MITELKDLKKPFRMTIITYFFYVWFSLFLFAFFNHLKIGLFASNFGIITGGLLIYMIVQHFKTRNEYNKILSSNINKKYIKSDTLIFFLYSSFIFMMAALISIPSLRYAVMNIPISEQALYDIALKTDNELFISFIANHYIYGFTTLIVLLFSFLFSIMHFLFIKKINLFYESELSLYEQEKKDKSKKERKRSQSYYKWSQID